LATGPPHLSPTLSGRVIRLRGLPYTTVAEDVLSFLAPTAPPTGEAGIIFLCSADGRATGEAYLELSSEEHVDAALARHKAPLGSRYIEVFKSCKGEMFQATHVRGFFTAVGGRRRTFLQHLAREAAPGDTALARLGPDGGGGGVGDLAASFAGFPLSQRDLQVPGPGRGFGGGGGGSGPSSAPRVWQPTLVAPRPRFNPAPGPSSMKGSRRPSMVGYNYMGQPVMMAPFVMQPPFMHGQQHHGGWGPGVPPGRHLQPGTWYPAPPQGAHGQHGGMYPAMPAMPPRVYYNYMGYTTMGRPMGTQCAFLLGFVFFLSSCIELSLNQCVYCLYCSPPT
jgi:hypothetical protein